MIVCVEGSLHGVRIRMHTLWIIYMKQYRFLTFLMAIAAGLAVIGCAEEMDDPALYTQTIRAVLNDGSLETRTCVAEGDNGMEGIMWTSGDAIGVYTASGKENAQFKTSITSPSGDADFTGTFTGTAAYAYYPYSKSNDGKNNISGTLPLTQEYSSATGVLPYDYKLGKPKDGSSNQFAFTHLFPLLRFTVDAEGTALEGKKLESVTVTFPSQISGGSFSVPVSGGNITWGSVEQGNALTLNWNDKPVLKKGETVFGYLACPPVSGLSGKTIKVTVVTEEYQAEFSAALKISAFVANTAYTFPLKLSAWKNVTGSGYNEINRNEPAEAPVITKLTFTPEKNSGKILSKELYYDESGANGLYTKTRTATAPSFTPADGKITGCILYLNNRNLVPDLEYTEGATVSYSVNGGDFVNWNGSSTIDFSKGTVLRVTMGGLSTDYVCEFTNSGLPVVVLNQTEGGDVPWPQLGINLWPKDAKWKTIKGENSTMTVYNADGTVNLETQTAMARLRGNTSMAYPKKPFAVKLDAEGGASILGMPAHDRWVLLANWKDKSLMCNHVAFGVANKFVEKFKNNANPGMLWNPHGEFVEVIYNGIHIGNYYLCEQIKVDAGRLAIRSPYDEESVITEADLANIGILIECDDAYDEEENGQFISKHYIPMMLKDAGDANGVILNHVKNKVASIEDNLLKNTSAGYTEAYKNIDIYSFADMLLVYELAMNSEMAHPKSAYMYIDGGGKLRGGPVWDFDWTSFPNNTNIKNNFDSSWDRSYTQSLMATKSHQYNKYSSSGKKLGHHVYGGSGDPSVNKSDVPYLWYPMLVKDDTFKNVLATRWSAISAELPAYAEEIKTTAQKIAVSWEYNNSIWPAYHSKNGRSEATGSIAFRGDENMTSWKEVYTNLYNVYMERLQGMNTFVNNQTWPSWTIVED